MKYHFPRKNQNANKINWFIFSGAILLIFLREPALFFTPRFWAEEGSIFYSGAFCKSFFESVFFAGVGYYTLFNNLISEIAVLIPVEYAPFVTTISGFIIQVLVLYIIIFTPSSYWDKGIKKAISCGVVILFAPAALWLNTTNIHAWFGLITLLISLTDLENLSRKQKVSFRILNSIFVLSGPESLFFIPIYLLRLLKEKKNEIKTQLIFLVFPGIIQAVIIIYSLFFNNQYERGTSFSIPGFFDFIFLNGFGMLFPDDIFIRKWMFAAIVLPVSLFFFWKSKSNDKLLYLILAFFISIILSALGSWGMVAAPRYSYLPTMILVLFFVQYIVDAGHAKIYYTYLLIFVLLIPSFFSVLFFRKNLNKYMQGWETVQWRNEVKRWRNDQDYFPRVLPVMGDFRVEMTKECKSQ